MPDMDLPPGAYRERKPKGWRWKLPWSHDDDVKMPMVMFFVALAVLVYIYVSREQLSPGVLFGVSAMFGAVAGGMLILWLRD